MRTAIPIMFTAFVLLAAPPPRAEQSYEKRRFVVEIISDAPGSEQKFRGVIGYDGQLQLIESRTPFRKKFSAVGLTGMFEATAADGKIVATLYEDQNGKLIKFGDVRGRSGKITEEPWHDCVTRSFGGF